MGRSFRMVLAGFALAACSGDAPPSDQTRAGDPIAADSAPTATLEHSVFVDAADGAQLVFVGQDSSIRPGDMSTASFVPMSVFSVERDGIPNEFPPADSMAAMLRAAGVGGERLVIVGEPIPAGRAYAALDYLGLGERASVLDGGSSALTSVPSADASAGAASPLQIDPRADMIVDAAWVQARLDDPAVAILDARPPAEYSGETPGQGIERPGHIPGARNLFWQTLVRGTDDTHLKDDAELRALFQAAGADPGDTLVAYCRTGGQASFLYAVARQLGYDVKLYDGSFIDWSRTDYPVER